MEESYIASYHLNTDGNTAGCPAAWLLKKIGK